LFGFAIGRLGESNMGEINCEKCESCCFFHTTTPCVTSNFLSLGTNLMLLNPIETWFATNFLTVERLFKFKPTIEQTVADPN
jgi:hypothetical protein